MTGQELTISLLMWIDYHALCHMLIIALKLEALKGGGGFRLGALRHVRGPKKR